VTVTLKIYFHLDHRRYTEVFLRCQQGLSYVYRWLYAQTRPAGIIGQWIDTWCPHDDYNRELGLFLEDDMVVSPYAYRWLRAVHCTYRNRSDFAGATLESGTIVYSANRRQRALAAPKNYTILMHKSFGTWGFAPNPLHWRQFQVCANSSFYYCRRSCCRRRHRRYYNYYFLPSVHNYYNPEEDTKMKSK